MVTETKLKLGFMVFTQGVNNRVAEDTNFARFVTRSMKRHANSDWGDLCNEDKELNDQALNEYNLRILSAYEADNLPKIWIITEWDRSVTTVLFPDEY